jgi:hypothetical protein
MRYLKKFIFFIFNLILSLKLLKIIHSEDSKQLKYTRNNRNNLTEEETFLLENGCLFIKNFFNFNEINNFNKNINFDKKKRNCHVSNNVIKQGSIIEKILSDEKIKNLLEVYLGKEAKLDFIEINRLSSNPEKKSVSEMWHYDCVGRRIKIFIFLNDCDNIYTDYVKTTNLNYYSSYTTAGSRRSDNFIKKKYDTFFCAKPKKGSIFIFDTNGYHRGSFRNFSDNVIRDTIQMEFSNFEKSKRLLDVGIDSIGIRDIFLDKDFNFNSSLIEKKCLVIFKEKNFYIYDYKFSQY